MPKYDIAITEWGPAIWKAIHSVAFTFPQNPTDIQRAAYKEWFELLTIVLPCVTCQAHFEELLTVDPVDVSSMKNLSQWSVRIHNAVNSSLGKPLMTYEEAVHAYLPPDMRPLVGMPNTMMPYNEEMLREAAVVSECNGWGGVQIAVVSIFGLVIMILLIFLIFLAKRNR